MLKAKMLSSGADTMVSIKDGTFGTLILSKSKRPVRRTRYSVSKSGDHSTSELRCHQEEPLRLLEEETLSSEQSRRTDSSNNSSSMEPPRPSSLNNTRTDHSTFRMPEARRTCKSGPPTPDGSNCSDSKQASWSMREDKSSKFKETETVRTLTSLLAAEEEASTNNGELSMLMNSKSNTNQENSTQTLACMLKENSQFLPACQVEDTWTLLMVMLL